MTASTPFTPSRELLSCALAPRTESYDTRIAWLHNFCARNWTMRAVFSRPAFRRLCPNYFLCIWTWHPLPSQKLFQELHMLTCSTVKP